MGAGQALRCERLQHMDVGMATAEQDEVLHTSASRTRRFIRESAGNKSRATAFTLMSKGSLQHHIRHMPHAVGVGVV